MGPRRHKFDRHQRVRLKGEGQDALYEFAGAGSEGWVRDVKHDHLGWPVIYVEWDQDHWTYNGEPDRWVMEDHFEPVEAQMSSDEDKKIGEMSASEFANMIANAVKGNTEPQQDKDDAQQRLLGTAEDVRQEARRLVDNSPSFLVLALDDHNGSMVPHVAQWATNSEQGLVLEAHLARISLASYEDLIAKKLREILQQERGQ